MLLAAATGAVAFFVQRSTGYLTDAEPAARVVMVFQNVWFHAWKTFVPLDLAPIYELPSRLNLLERPYLLSATGSVATTIVVWLLRKRWPAGLATQYALKHGIVEPPGGLQIEAGIPFPLLIVIGVTIVMTFLATRRRFGREVAERHQVPVYFYAKAASRPERVRLPDIRKPEYEGLAALLDTTHIPDAGPKRMHPTAGAIVVGARPFLIAFNIELDSTDLKLAQRIAKEIRESSGGLPAVQAKGFMLTDPPRVQVSMNLLDHTVTSLATVWREVETRATAAGVKVLRGELIGLIPLDAVLGPARQLDDLVAEAVAARLRVLHDVAALDQRGQQPMRRARLQARAMRELHEADLVG